MVLTDGYCWEDSRRWPLALLDEGAALLVHTGSITVRFGVGKRFAR